MSTLSFLSQLSQILVFPGLEKATSFALLGISIIVILFLSIVISYLITPIIVNLAFKYQLVDNPATRPHPAHTHKGIIPRAGGLAIYFGIFITVFMTLPLSKTLIGIFISSTILILVGLWDDRKDRSPYIRFFTNCLAAFFVILAGVNIPYITNPFGGVISLVNERITIDFLGQHSLIIWANIFAFFWIIWTTNIIGWSGGVDGQLPGFVSISSFIIGLLSLRFASQDPNQTLVTYLSFAVTGAFLGFLPWNFYPQKIMPGYGGKTLAGFLLAVLSIMSFSKLGTALIVLAIPMIDALFMFVKRILSGKSPVFASSGHLHHHLLTLGWGKRRVAFFYWIISFVFGMIALMLNSRQKIFIAVLVLVIVFGFILWVNSIRKINKKIEDY